ncbi:hypothetical protein HanRHA438_Chr15g0701961 [Helianthus annuus]|nr:hypothetical protein HanRHA438_Chr15g0701961 [Helianthus annuus]
MLVSVSSVMPYFGRDRGEDRVPGRSRDGSICDGDSVDVNEWCERIKIKGLNVGFNLDVAGHRFTGSKPKLIRIFYGAVWFIYHVFIMFDCVT